MGLSFFWAFSWEHEDNKEEEKGYGEDKEEEKGYGEDKEEVNKTRSILSGYHRDPIGLSFFLAFS